MFYGTIWRHKILLTSYEETFKILRKADKYRRKYLSIFEYFRRHWFLPEPSAISCSKWMIMIEFSSLAVDLFQIVISFEFLSTYVRFMLTTQVTTRCYMYFKSKYHDESDVNISINVC